MFITQPARFNDAINHKVRVSFTYIGLLYREGHNTPRRAGVRTYEICPYALVWNDEKILRGRLLRALRQGMTIFRVDRHDERLTCSNSRAFRCRTTLIWTGISGSSSACLREETVSIELHCGQQPRERRSGPGFGTGIPINRDGHD
jgi:hypothetical protein